MRTLLEKRVLSIQSHVVHGYVGNKCSQFTLQSHEFEVDTINSVQFSNHTAYKTWKGEILTDEQLTELYNGLKQNNLNVYSHLLTGYARSISFLVLVSDIVKDLRKMNKDLVYICDPVMGDNGSFYVPETLLPIYRDVLVPLADVVTPNQFELQVLSGIIIKTEKDALDAMSKMHDCGCSKVVVSSTDLAPSQEIMYIYSGDYSVQGRPQLCRFEVPRYPAVFWGTGDLFASLLLVWLVKTQNLREAVRCVLSCLHAVLENTYQHAERNALDPKHLSVADLELRLIQSRREILEPKYDIKAVDL